VVLISRKDLCTTSDAFRGTPNGVTRAQGDAAQAAAAGVSLNVHHTAKAVLKQLGRLAISVDVRDPGAAAVPGKNKETRRR
jgi:hypothetical protein